jgi:hypothetical protein
MQPDVATHWHCLFVQSNQKPVEKKNQGKRRKRKGVKDKERNKEKKKGKKNK